MIRTGNRYPQKLYHGPRRVHALTRGSRPVYVSPEMQSAILTQWLKDECKTTIAMTDDAVGKWMEMEITLPAGWSGTAATGYTGPLQPGGASITLSLQYSTDLTAWTSAGWIDTPGTSAATLGDGRRQFFARYSTPQLWKSVMIDLTATTDRFGKSITGISVLGVPVTSGMNYPYAMPAAAATLQTHLRAAGFTGAVVSTSSAAMSVRIGNYYPKGRQPLTAALSGQNVTGVSFAGSAITAGMSYPYAMPAARATLQTHLRNAGYDGAVVMLHDDPWTIVLPDRAAGFMRPFYLTISPGDPYPTWDFFENYTGLAAADGIGGTSGNVRTPGGAPLIEHATAFARLHFIP